MELHFDAAWSEDFQSTSTSKITGSWGHVCAEDGMLPPSHESGTLANIDHARAPKLEAIVKTVVVEDYNPEWPVQYEQLKTQLIDIMERGHVPYVSVEHVGSTSVPGLAAKSNIDIDIIVRNEDVEDAIWALNKYGNYDCLGIMGIPDRWSLRKHYMPPHAFIKHNLYVCVQNSLVLRNHLSVRSVLRENGQLRSEYGNMKKSLAARRMHLLDYNAAKLEVIDRILEIGGMGLNDRAAIRAMNNELYST